MVWAAQNTPPYFVVKAVPTLAYANADVKRKLSDSGKTVTV